MRGAQPWRTNRARVLRADDTSAEARLWNELTDRRLGGLKFVRQAPIANHYVDFLCRERKVIIEIDGGTHSADAEIANDAERTDKLKQLAIGCSEFPMPMCTTILIMCWMRCSCL